MSNNKVSAQESLAFFRSYGQSRSKTPAPQQVSLMTQAPVHPVEAPPTPSGVAQIIPMNKGVGTPQSRLRDLRVSPKNHSPHALNPPVRLLPPVRIGSPEAGRVTLVLDVDETLLHSSYTPEPDVRYDDEFVVEVQGRYIGVFVRYRPHVRAFLEFVAARFEVVIFTASLALYCDPLLDHLDPKRILGNLRLYREHCTSCGPSHVKDLSLLDRDLERVVIIDNSPVCFMFQQRNAIPISTWRDDPHDTALLDLLPLLDRLSRCRCVYDILDEYNAGIAE